MMGNYCTYEHWRPDTNQVFYVGKGSVKRANDTTSRNEYYKNIKDKLQSAGLYVEVRIALQGIPENVAFNLESLLIEHYRECGIRLANLTNGGEGVSGYKWSDDMKKMSRLYRSGTQIGHKPTFSGKHKEETIKQMSETHKEIWSGRSKEERAASEETKKKMSIVRKGVPWSDARRAAHNASKKGKII